LISLFKAIQSGWQPPLHISEDEYNDVKNNKDKFPDYYVGFIGFNATFGAKYFGGYARGFKTDKFTPRDMPNEAIRNLLKQKPAIQDVKFTCSDYMNNDFIELKNAVIYCDPPYQGTTKYSTGQFDHVKFWNWCREMSKNNYLFVSEYNCPDDFMCIWSKNVTTSLKVFEHESRVEKLFTYRE